MSEPPVWLRGKRAGIGPLRADLVPTYWEWESDPGAILGYGRQVPDSLENRTEGYGHQVRTAEFLILLGPQARGRGLATEATLLTLDYGFHVAALRMIWLKVLEPNEAGIRTYTGAGFKPAGQLRQAGYWLGEPCDEIIMDALRADFPGPSCVRSRRGGCAGS